EPLVGVALVRDAPVEEEDVVALVEEELDERVALPQVEDVGAVDEREYEQDRHRVLALAAPVAPERRVAVRPDGVLRRRADRRVALGEDRVGELERGDRRAGEALEGGHDDEEGRAAATAAASARTAAAARAPAARPVRGRVGLQVVAEALDLLQHLLELVLG